MTIAKPEREHQLIRAAIPELLAFCAAMRPDWNADATAGAVAMCHQRGWPWSRTVAVVTSLLCNPKGLPRDIANAAANPIQRHEVSPDVYERGLAEVRAAAGIGAAEKLIDPDCKAGKHAPACPGAPCECGCHNPEEEK